MPSFTITMPTTSVKDAMQLIGSVKKRGVKGLWDDLGVFHPYCGIQSLSVAPSGSGSVITGYLISSTSPPAPSVQIVYYTDTLFASLTSPISSSSVSWNSGDIIVFL